MVLIFPIRSRNLPFSLSSYCLDPISGDTILKTTSLPGRSESDTVERRTIIKVITQNKKARFNYDIDEVIEAGMVLTGTEVKALRIGKANIGDSYVRIRGSEAFVYKMHIGPYPLRRFRQS